MVGPSKVEVAIEKWFVESSVFLLQLEWKTCVLYKSQYLLVYIQ